MLSEESKKDIAYHLCYAFKVRPGFWQEGDGPNFTYGDLIKRLENRLAGLYGRYVSDGLHFRKSLDSLVFDSVDEYYSQVDEDRFTTIEYDYIVCRQAVIDIMNVIINELGVPNG